MTWKNLRIDWVDTEHSWNDFGKISHDQHAGDDLDAKVLTVWRSQKMSDIIESILDAASTAADYADDPELATGFAVAVAASNLFPLHLKIVWQDEHAEIFLKLLYTDANGQYFLKSDLNNTPEIVWLITYFLKHGIFTEGQGRLTVNGRVLKRAHIVL